MLRSQQPVGYASIDMSSKTDQWRLLFGVSDITGSEAVIQCLTVSLLPLDLPRCCHLQHEMG